jgi:hypothetical protein
MKLQILVYVSSIILSSNAFGQMDSNKKIFSYTCDTITKSKFDKLVKKYFNVMKSKDTFAIGELLDIIKVCQSLIVKNYDSSSTNRKYKKYLDLYGIKMIAIACNDKLLGYAPLQGLVCYSFKYKIYITPPIRRSEMPCYNYYFIKVY